MRILLYCLVILVVMACSSSKGDEPLLYTPAPDFTPVPDEITPLYRICNEEFTPTELEAPPLLVEVIVTRETHCQWVTGRDGDTGYAQIIPKFYTGKFNIQHKRGNLLAAGEILAGNIRQYGMCDGVRRYNGSGKAAECYAYEVVGEFEHRTYGTRNKRYKCPVDRAYCEAMRRQQ